MDTSADEGVDRREQLLRTRDQAKALALRAKAFQHGLEMAKVAALEEKARRAKREERSSAAIEAAECKNLWEDIVELQQSLTALQTRSAAAPTAASSSAPTYRSLLQGKIHRYEAEYRALLESSGMTVETEEETIEAIRQEVKENIADLDKGFKLLEQQRANLTKALEEEKERHEQHLQIQRALQQKLDAAQQQAQHQRDGTEPTSAHAELQGKVKAVGLENRRLMSRMAAFMTKYFPPPTDEDASGVPTKKSRPEAGVMDSASKRNKSKIATLSEFLEDLMNACMSRPHDPYITLSDKHWPPYVELLVRSGIAVSHPKQSDRLKLVEFHA